MRTIALALLLAAASCALAQPTAIESVRDTLANHLNAITIDCPVELDKPIACYRYGSTIELHKVMLDTFAMTRTEFVWVVPWTERDGILARAFTFADARELYLVGLVEDGWQSVAFVMYSGRVE